MFWFTFPEAEVTAAAKAAAEIAPGYNPAEYKQSL